MRNLENSILKLSEFNLQGFLVRFKKALEAFKTTMQTTIYKKG